MFTVNLLGRMVDTVDSCPWGSVAGRAPRAQPQQATERRGLYSAEERKRRDASGWTVVQGILAPVQFLIFVISLVLVVRTLMTGEGASTAMFSIVVKTLVLYTIMITGSIWEREVFGRYLFAPAFYWEDMVSMLVLALHTAYLVALVTGALETHQLLVLALAAYASYAINATQFVMKLRAARLEQDRWPAQTLPTGALGASQ